MNSFRESLRVGLAVDFEGNPYRVQELMEIPTPRHNPIAVIASGPNHPVRKVFASSLRPPTEHVSVRGGVYWYDSALAAIDAGICRFNTAGSINDIAD